MIRHILIFCAVLLLVTHGLLATHTILRIYKEREGIKSPPKVEKLGPKVTEQDLQLIWKDLKRAAGAEWRSIPLKILKSEDMNASATCSGGQCRIIVTKKFLDFFSTKHEAAYILGHELGHHILGHLVFPTSLPQVYKEINADRIGVFLMLRAGYNPCLTPALWTRFLRKYGEIIRTTTHSSFAQRAYLLKLPYCQKSA